jgi:hypothetical protein
MTGDAGSSSAGAPWYRHFWPWFIVGLLATAVVASLSTVVIAVSGRDSLVRDDYYRDGMAINRRLGREAEAERLGIGAELRFDAVTGDLQLRLRGGDTQSLDALDLSLSHPTRAERDTRVRLQRGADQVFRASLDEPLQGSWYAALLPAEEAVGGESAGSLQEWRISQRIVVHSDEPIGLGALP